MRFLLQFRGLHNDLRIGEFYAVLSAIRNTPEKHIHTRLTPAFTEITGVPVRANPSRGYAGTVLYGEIFYYADLQSEQEAITLAARSILIRGVYFPVGHGLSYAECVSSIDKSPFENALTPVRDTYSKPSFRCFVQAFGKKVSVEQQLERIHAFSSVLATFPGRVRMKNPQHELWILEDDFPRDGHGRRNDEGPRQVFLARKVVRGQGHERGIPGVGPRRHVRESFSLKSRRYIGPTSMDAELSFVMANMARVEPGKLVIDPFCGTGGVLVACAARGALVIGSDINILTLRGKGKHCNLESNFHQYGLTPPLGTLRADILNSPIHRNKKGWFDAVVCDPPYGIKEGMKVFREDRIDESLEKNHFQGTERIQFVDFLHGVLDFAVDVLVPGGRLVYWLPTTKDYSDDDVPMHPALEILHNNEQPLTARMSRRLITMERLPDGKVSAGSRTLREDHTNGLYEDDNERPGNGHRPAHFDLACKLMRQPERAESRLRRREDRPTLGQG